MFQMLEQVLPLLRCPECHQAPLQPRHDHLLCNACGRQYEIQDGIIVLLSGKDRSLAQKAYGQFAAVLYDSFAARGGARRLYARRFKDEFMEYTAPLKVQKSDVVLDVGCGTGNYTFGFARLASGGLAVGIDLSRAMLLRMVQHARRADLKNLIAIQGSAENLPFRDEVVSRVFHGCMHYLSPNVLPSLREAYRCLADSGIFYGVTIFKARSRVTALLQQLAVGGATHPVTADVLFQGLLKAGFSNVDVKSAGLERFYFGTYTGHK